jgi:predicted O-methyltransferase YrrM
MRNRNLIASALRAATKDPTGFLRGAARLPLEQQAAERIRALPIVELAEISGETVDVPVRLAPTSSRHAWSLGVAEQLILQVLVRARGCHTAFEIGTFNGGTTRLLAEALPADGRVWTIDLPQSQFDATQAPAEFDGSKVGMAYRDSPDAGKITQIFGDSLAYDFSSHERSSDLVLVDGGHEYVNGLADTKTALQLIRPGGIVLWDDFQPYWHGLVNGICDAMDGRRLGRLAGTSYAVYAHDALR